MVKMFVRSPDRVDVAVQVVQAERVDYAVLVTQGGVPVDLIRERVPRESRFRNAGVAHAQDIGLLLPESLDRLVIARPFLNVGLRVHDRQPVAVVVLPDDLDIARPRWRR